MKKERYLISDLKLDTAVAYSAILSLRITSGQGEHGRLYITLEVDEGLSQSDVLRYNDTDVAVSLSDGRKIFSGVCTGASLSNQGQYKCVMMEACTRSVKMDSERKKAVFQDPGKTLQDILGTVCASYGAVLSLDSDPAMKNVEYQQDETDWAFLKRLSAAQQKAVFTDLSGGGINIYCGETGFRSFGGDILAEQCGSSRNVSELARAGELESVSGYMFDTVEYLSADPCASAGDLVDGKYCVRRSELTLDGGALTNRLWLGYSDSMRPSVEESTQPSFTSGVLQGTVLAVSGNQVQVQFDSDAGGGSAMWIPYESAISNSFYCMPDEGDRVFVYQENDGKAVCLGSRHVETGRPDFTKPKEDVLTNHDKMVKLGETALTITATRDAHDSGSGDEITIHMDSDEGITISSGKDIYIMTAANMNIGARVPEDADEMQKEGHDRVKERDAEGDATYSVESLEYFGGAALGGLLKESTRQFGEDVKQQAIDTIKAMTFADLWFPKTENAAVGSEEAFETGVVTLYGYDHLVLSVGENKIELGADDISITTDKFYWLGYERQKHSPEEIPLKDWWETALDGLQLVLDIAGMIPVFGAIPDLINAGVSLARGNYVEAAMSAFAAIPGIGDAAGALKTGAKVVKTVTKLTKAEKIIKTIQLLYQGLQLAYSVYQNREAIANIWNKLTTGTLDLRNIDDVNDLLSVLNLAPGMVQFGMDANNLRKGQKVDYSVDGPDKKLDAQTTNSDNDYCATDPVNVVTGSLVADYDDLQLRDIRETFILRRTYESAYENKGLLLGSRWFLNIESRTAMEGDTMKVQLPDMHLLSFRRTGDGGWENMKAGDRSMELTDTADGMQLKDNRGRKTYRYTKDGRLESVSDRYGNTTRFLYEGGVLYRMELAGGQYLDFEMKNGRLDTIRDTMGRTYRYEYEGELLTCVTLANGGKIRYEYTSEGWMKRITDQNGKCYVSNEYDLRGRVVKQTTADGSEYAMFYDAAKHCNTFTDLATGEVTRYEYGRQRVPTRTIYADGTYTETRYDEWENKIYERDRNGAETFRSFDRYGNLLEERLPSGLATTNTYDDGGNIIRQTDSMGREVRWEYDEKGMLTGEHMLLDRDTWCSMRFEWDRHGRLLKETNPNGNETRYRYDTMFSEPSARILPEGGTTWYTYDAAGRMTELRDALGTVRYSYNRTDAVTEVVDRTGGITRYGYDRLGNKTRETRPEQHESGKGTVYEYDCLDHLVRVTTPEGSVYAYRKGSDDRLLKAVSPNAYDPETGDGDGMAFDHDATGRRIRVHYPDGGCERYFLDGNGNITKRVQPEQYDEEKDDGAGYAYEYDTAGRLTRITDPYGRQVRQYAYDEAGYITRSTDARMGETLYRYNLAGWLVEKREQTGRGEDGTASYRLTTYTYDSMGNRLTEKRYTMPQEITGMSGATHTIRYGYDRDNRLVKVSDCTGAAVTYHYGKHGLVDRERVRTGGDAWKETRYLYDAQGRVTKTAEVLSDGVYSITEYAYDRNGNIMGVTMPEGGRISYAYDAEDRLIYEAHEGECISSSLTYAYDKTGNLVSVTDADGHTETYDYDLLNRETRRTARDGGVQETLYDKNGNAVRRINPVQYLSDKSGLTYSYDLCNRLSRVTSPAGSILEENTYNAAGDLLKRTDGMGNGVSMAYDLMGRRLSAATAAGSTQQWEYDAMGNVRASTDGCGNRTEFTLDKWGRITGIRKADGSHESYTYDLMGNMTSSTDGEGHTTLMEYDTSGQMVKRTDPSGKTEYYGYDREKRLVSSTDRNGSTTRYTYNMYGSLTGRVTTSADRERTITESFGYYPDGRLKSATAGGMRYDYAYDAAGRLKTKRASGVSLLSYEYDLNGNRTGMTDVTGKHTAYRYNSLNQLEEITDSGRSLARYSYNADGTIKRLEVGNSLVTEYGYDADRNITSQKTVMTGMPEHTVKGLPALPGTGMNPVTIVDNTYTYDGNANRITKDTLSGKTGFGYDRANRLVRAEYPQFSEEYRYDRAGNRTSRNRTSKGNAERREETYSYDACNRLTVHDITGFRDDGTQENTRNLYTYDMQGNMLSDGDRQYSYDVRNRLAEVRTANGSWQKNHYDGEGLRAELEENGRLVRFIYDGDKAVLEGTDENTIRHIRGYELVSSDSEAAKTYYHYASDELGSITHVTDEDGNVLNRYEYDAFGNFTLKEETVENRFGFAGEQYDPAANLYYLRARFYNPVIGRFIQEDTYYGDGLNLYTYCHNNPVGYVDPSGHATKNCPNKQAAIDHLKKQGLSEKEAIEKYDEVRGSSNSAKEAREKITGNAENKPEKYKTPYSQLSPKQRKELKEKLKKGLISRDEYKHLDWDRRFRNRRNRGVNRFWANEKRRLKNGEPGTRNWSAEQRRDILKGKVPKYEGEPIEGHHKYNAIDYPQLADDPNNIYPATNNEHFNRWHGGNYQNDTNGVPNNYDFEEEF